MAAAKKSKAKYGKGSQNEVKKEMRRFKKGTAKSGKAGTKVKSKKQAVAIALSKARKKGMKLPKKAAVKTKKVAKKKTTRKAATRKKAQPKTAAKSKGFLSFFLGK